MSKTIELRSLIKKILEDDFKIPVFYEEADKDSIYPYLVYDLDSTSFSYDHRDDIILYINIWDKNKSSKEVEKLTDKIEKIFKFKNNPTENIQPTFYIETRRKHKDENKLIKRRELVIEVQNYDSQEER